MKEKILKLCKYCAYRDRSLKEVKEKLKELHVDQEKSLEVITYLMDNNYLDNKRYAISFARGKFYNNKWGRIKIRSALVQNQIDQVNIEKALNEIPQDDYIKTLRFLVERESKRHQSHKNGWARVVRYLSSRGYELDLVYKLQKRKQ